MVRATVAQLQEMHRILKAGGAEYDASGNIVWGSWKRGAAGEAAKALNVHTNTIYNWTKEFPKSPEREPRKKEVKPSYIEEFDSSKTVQDFIESYKTKSRTIRETYYRSGLMGWTILNKKEPLSWTEEDYKTLWNHPDFRDSETGRTSFSYAVGLRKWMLHCKMYDLLKDAYFDTRDLKRQAGAKLTHYLKSETELVDVINNIQYPDTLMMFDVGIQCGGRWSSLQKIKPQDISYQTNMIVMKEPKVRQILERVFIPETMDVIKQYIYDFNFKGDQRIFPRRMDAINDDLTQAGKAAKITFDLTTHTAIKHTFVSLAANHGVSLEIVSKQTGTDPSTLMKFYAGIGKQKIRHELLGEEYVRPTYHELMRKIQPVVMERYAQIKDRLKAVDGISKKYTKKTEKPKQKRKINWGALEALADSDKTKEPSKKAFKQAIKLHDQGLSDDEIREKMGWKK
jgi:hypothetical protein